MCRDSRYMVRSGGLYRLFVRENFFCDVVLESNYSAIGHEISTREWHLNVFSQFYWLCTSVFRRLFRKQANCLSPFRGDGRGVKIHMKKFLFHVSRHITNLFLETRNMRKQWEYFLLTLFYLCFTKLNNRKQADMSVFTSTPSISK